MICVELCIIEGAFKNRMYRACTPDIKLIGRSDDCDMKLPHDDPYISRYQFMIEVTDSDVILRDLISKNGTTVDGVKFGGRLPGQDFDLELAKTDGQHVELFDSSLISIGKTKIKVNVFDLDEEEAEELPEFEELPEDEAFPLVDEDSSEMDEAELQEKILQIKIVPEEPPLEDFYEDNAYADENFELSTWFDIDGVVANSGENLVSLEGFTILGTIGRGAFGKVFKAQNKENGSLVAIKLIPSYEDLRGDSFSEFKKEALELASLRHRNLIRFVGDYGLIKNTNYLFFVSEYCQKENLVTWSSKLKKHFGNNASVNPEFIELLCYKAIDCLTGLKQLHNAGFIHRDIKPTNLLVRSDGTGILSDYNLIKCLEHFPSIVSTANRANCIPFMSREQFISPKKSNLFSDLFSLAVSLYYIQTGFFPYNSENPSTAVYTDVLKGDFISPDVMENHCGESMTEFYINALDINPDQRLYKSAEEMILALSRVIQKL